MNSAEAARTYRLTPEAIEGIVERVSRRRLVLLSCAIAAGLYALIKDSRLNVVGLGTAMCVMTVLFGLVVFAHVRGLTRLHRALASYAVITGPECLIRKQSGSVDLRLEGGQIASASETPHILVVTGAADSGTIVVLRGLDGYEELRERVASWADITAQSASGMWRRTLLRWTTVAAFAAAVLAVFGMSDRRIVVPLSVPVATVLVWSFWSVQRSRTADRGTKHKAWVMLLPLAAIVVKVWMLLA